MNKPRFEFTNGAPEEVMKLGLPQRKTMGSAGYDFVAPRDMHIFPGKVEKCETFIKAYMPPGIVLMLFVRSSIGIKKNLVLSNGTGIIDSDYYCNPDNDGNIIGALYNESEMIQHIKRGEAFMQGVFVPYVLAEDDDAQGVRVGGIGSTTTSCAMPIETPAFAVVH